jgi:transcriptional regulator with XRE-family HTH domain
MYRMRYTPAVARIRPFTGTWVEDTAYVGGHGWRMPTLAGALVVQARQLANMSQEELARRAGTSRAAISAIEHGKRDPGLERLQTILRAAGFDVLTRLAHHDDHDDSLRSERHTADPAERRRQQDAYSSWVTAAQDAWESTEAATSGG